MFLIEPGFYLFGALILLLLPLDWIIAVCLSGLWHEVCHIVILSLMGGKIQKVSIRPDGCTIKTGRLEFWQQILSILAGPAGSLSLLFLLKLYPKMAVCGFLQGLFNLIPILPLDGGRILQLILYRINPKKAEFIMETVSSVLCIVFFMMGMIGTFYFDFGAISVIVSLILILRCRREKYLANYQKSGYNRHNHF